MDDHTYDGNTEDNLGAEPTFSNGNDAVCILDIENPYHNIHGEFDHVEDWSSPRYSLSLTIMKNWSSHRFKILNKIVVIPCHMVQFNDILNHKYIRWF